MREEGDRLAFAKIIRMVLAVKMNVTLDPMKMRLLRAAAIVQAPDGGANLVKHSGLLWPGWTMFLRNSMLAHGIGNNIVDYAEYQGNVGYPPNQNVDFTQQLTDTATETPCYSAFRLLILRSVARWERHR